MKNKSSDHSKDIKEYDAQEEKFIKFCQHCKYSTIRSSINDKVFYLSKAILIQLLI